MLLLAGQLLQVLQDLAELALAICEILYWVRASWMAKARTYLLAAK
jgi:hypothetical protein